MKLRTACVAVLLSASVLFAQQETEWSTYSSTEGKCEIKFPGKPKTKGDKVTKQAILEVQGGKAVYILGVTAMPKDIATDDKAAVKKIFDAGRDSTVNSLKGSKVLKETDITTAGNPGRDIEVEVPNLGIYRARFILTPQTFYQIVLLGPKDFVEADDANKFRKSFKIKAAP